jgi:uncharacterized OB-fold protein
MPKHKFRIGLKDEHQNVVGAKCDHCGEIVFYAHGVIPPRKMAEECRREDFSQDAALPMPSDSIPG